MTIVDQYFADKTEADSERERALLDQWVCLTEERNAVMVPAPGSGIPGAPADGESAPNMERHTPVLFLDLNGECFQCLCKIHIYRNTCMNAKKPYTITYISHEIAKYIFFYIFWLFHLCF